MGRGISLRRLDSGFGGFRPSLVCEGVCAGRLATSQHVEEHRLRHVLVEQVDVGVERERGLVVAEPSLHLHRVSAAPEEHRGAGVAEAVVADPRVGAELAALPDPLAELGYVSDPRHALNGEPEAVSEEEQLRISRASRRLGEERRREAWRRAHEGIDRALSDFKRDGRPSRQLLSDLRVIERQASRVDRRLGL
jgi:hypothetical protein